MLFSSIWNALLFIILIGNCFYNTYGFILSRQIFFHPPTSSILCESRFDGKGSETRQKLEEYKNKAMIEGLMFLPESKVTSSDVSSPLLVELGLLGQGCMNYTNTETSNTVSLLLSTPSWCEMLEKKQSDTLANLKEEQVFTYRAQGIPVLPVPLESPSYLELVSFAYKSQPISKSLCLTLNPLLINRDNGLYDNLPWHSWTIDPLFRNRDHAGNDIEERFHFGKRDAYNRFMGKDWYGRSLSIGNMAARVKYLLDIKTDSGGDDRSFSNERYDKVSVSLDDDAIESLAKRIMQLELKEAQRSLAEVEEDLAIHLAHRHGDILNHGDDDDWESTFETLQIKLQSIQDSIVQTQQKMLDMDAKDMDPEKESIRSIFTSFLDRVISDNQSDAPYRGALGYKPLIDSEEEMHRLSILPYCSPFDLMNEIINEQLNAEVIGCVIENTSIAKGTVSLGGGVVIKRRGRKKSFRVDGEDIEIDDSDDGYGNDVKKGEIHFVECDCDEAIGMALSSGMSILCERSVFESLQSSFREQEQPAFTEKGISKSSSLFPTDNPIQSLTAYDEMSMQKKISLLKSLDSFNGQIPRARVLRRFEREETTLKDPERSSNHPINELLIPLIDESVRRRILIRDAENDEDYETAATLSQEMSKRQKAKQLADQARKEGETNLAEAWDDEADFYASLRADVTQDEGSYDKFLEKDEWYERDRLKSAQRAKKKFGTLLDGLEDM